MCFFVKLFLELDRLDWRDGFGFVVVKGSGSSQVDANLKVGRNDRFREAVFDGLGDNALF